VLVAAHHGQAEPVLVALGLGAILLARRGGAGLAGALIGTAIAAKTWPVLLLPGVLAAGGRRAVGRVLAGAAAVVVAAVASLGLLQAPFAEALHRLVGYRSLAGRWGWGALLHRLDVVGFGYHGGGLAAVQAVGGALTLAAVAAALYGWYAGGGTDVELAVALPLAVLAVAPGFGVQYLTWPLALLLVRGGRLVSAYRILAGAWAIAFYVAVVPDDRAEDPAWFAWSGLAVWGVVLALSLRPARGVRGTRRWCGGGRLRSRFWVPSRVRLWRG
jgi:hypothetical protein